ncbi:MAG: AIPR family protein [Phycisphaerales bacterium]|nr:AIPR family protein [Phycisphaerales bacterium]
MTNEAPYEITHVPKALHTAFDGRLPVAANGTPEEKERNFLTRALAAYSIHKLTGCSLDDAAAAVVDGGGDGGIDAVHHSPTSNTLWLVQSKYMDDGRGEPALGDVAKFKTGIENLLKGELVAFKANGEWVKRLPMVEARLKDSSLQVRVVLAYSGIHTVSEDRQRMFADLERRFNNDDDYLRCGCYNLTSVHAWIVGADRGPGVQEVELEILKPGWVKDPFETIYGLVRLADIAALQRAHPEKLIAANIRKYKGTTDVNDQIVATLTAEPQHFIYLNNGLTAYCERLEVHNPDRDNADRKRIKAHGFSIVNGAQTLGSVEKACPAAGATPNGFVFIKVISLERCEDDEEFAHRITRSTNFQNQIGARDFVALDGEQERIARQLALDGIHYHYKEGADVPEPDAANFTLEEATIALACLEQQRDCDFCTRILANRNSLWSFEPVFPAGHLQRSRYEKLFRPERSARLVWRSVQAARAVFAQVRDDARASSGIRKAFFENARWLVLNAVFLRKRPEAGEAIALTAGEVAALRADATDVAEALWTVCERQGFVSARAVAAPGEPYQQTKHFRSVFCAPGDCERLRTALLAELNTRQRGPAPAPAAATPPQAGPTATATPTTQSPGGQQGMVS